MAEAQKPGESKPFGEWLLGNMITVLAASLFGCITIWCFCSCFAGRNDKKVVEVRRRRRAEQEEEELAIQTNLYNRMEVMQRKIMQLLQDRIMEFQRHFKPTKDQEEVYLPDFMIDGLPVYQMDRDDIDDEFEKITLE